MKWDSQKITFSDAFIYVWCLMDGIIRSETFSVIFVARGNFASEEKWKQFRKSASPNTNILVDFLTILAMLSQ